ncbi:MAG: hypothetical protein IMF19_15130 [Proteobacteria bacterium]|nr:hypothetical protein [Pseudomonadota bacterium]
MNRLLSVEAIFDGEKIKMPEINIPRPCKVIITFLDEPSQSEDEEIFDILLKSDSAFDFLKSEKEDIYTDDDLIERFE